MSREAQAPILIVEDHPAVRHGLRSFLELQGLGPILEAETAQDALTCLEAATVALAMVDLSLGEEDGTDLIRTIAEAKPGLPVLVYSMFDHPAHIHRALQSGATGYLTKREDIGLLPQAVRACLDGERYLSPRAQERLKVGEEGLPIGTLSPKEVAVFHLLGQGLPNSAIAARLDLSPRTVETYFGRMVQKLGLAGVPELRQKAIQAQGEVG